MFEEQFENSQEKNSAIHTTERKFGTVLTQSVVTRRILTMKSFASTVQINPEPISDLYTDMYQTLHSIESVNIAKTDYMSIQPDINSNMRAILIDWLVSIQYKMRFSGETLYITINLVDRYLEIVKISRKDLQLVGICAMLIACKYEETVVPNIKDLVYITADAYNKEQVLDMELKIVTELKFNLASVTCLRFIERYSDLLGFSQREYYLARYFSELSLLDYHFIQYKPSALASACVYLASKYRGCGNNACFQSFIPYFYNEIKDCVLDLVRLINKYKKCSLQAIKSKYALESFFEVSLIPDNPYILEERILNETEYY